MAAEAASAHGPEQVPGTLIKDKWKKGEILDLEQTVADVSVTVTNCCHEAASTCHCAGWQANHVLTLINPGRSVGRELLE